MSGASERAIAGAAYAAAAVAYADAWKELHRLDYAVGWGGDFDVPVISPHPQFFRDVPVIVSEGGLNMFAIQQSPGI